LNAWVGGFQTILKRMGVSNFNWFLHTMLFIHTKRIIEKQRIREREMEEMDLDVNEESDEDDDDDDDDDAY
jgi:hypothetical protein